MPRFKRLSGSEVIKILEKFDFQVHSQRGSHVKMRRITETGKETMTPKMGYKPRPSRTAFFG
jgi:predicted RNA binding protein YcfA (HicA-like mRNA interferase family)